MKTLLFAILILCFAAISSRAQSLPDAPSATKPVEAKPARFLTFRKSWQDPPLRTHKQVFHSKRFLFLHAAYAASVIADIQHTHGKREDWPSEGPVIPAIIGLDYIAARFFCECYSVGPPIYAVQHYVRDALR
jgi:hypothetical protein